MKMKLLNSVPENEYISYSEALKIDGIYLVERFPNYRAIIIDGILVLYIYENQLKVVLNADEWKKDKFKLTNEQLILN